jgi:hypothetical protein
VNATPCSAYAGSHWPAFFRSIAQSTSLSGRRVLQRKSPDHGAVTALTKTPQRCNHRSSASEDGHGASVCQGFSSIDSRQATAAVRAK